MIFQLIHHFKAVDCGPLTVNNSLGISRARGTLFKDTATISCREGYTANNRTGQVECLAGGTWSPFHCEGKYLLYISLEGN